MWTAVHMLLGVRFPTSVSCFSRFIQKNKYVNLCGEGKSRVWYVCDPSAQEAEAGGCPPRASLRCIDPASNRQRPAGICLTHATKQEPNLQMKQASCLQEIIVLLGRFLCVHTFSWVHVCWGHIPVYMYESACGGPQANRGVFLTGFPS